MVVLTTKLLFRQHVYFTRIRLMMVMMMPIRGPIHKLNPKPWILKDGDWSGWAPRSSEIQAWAACFTARGRVEKVAGLYIHTPAG